MFGAGLSEDWINRRSSLVRLGRFAALAALPTGTLVNATAKQAEAQLIANAARQLKADAWRLPRGLRLTNWLTPAAAESIGVMGVEEDQITAAFALFLSGSQILFASRSSGHPVVGYYNPVIDAWWITLWRASEQVTEAKFLPAPLFSDSATPGVWRTPVDNLSPRRTLIESLTMQLRRALRSFRDEFAIEGSGSKTIFDRIAAPDSAGAEIGHRIAVIASELSEFNADLSALAAYTGLTSALAKQAPDAVLGLSAQASEVFDQLAALPLAERSMLVPVGAWKIDQTWLVVSATPAAAGTLVLAALKRDLSSPIYRLAMISPFGAEP